MTWTAVAANTATWLKPSSVSLTITDSFNRDDGSLGTAWTEQTNAPTISDNAVVPGSVAGLSLAYRSGESYGMNHSSAISIVDAASTTVIVGVNMSGSAAHGYLLRANPASGTWNLNAYASGALAVFWSASGSTAWVDDDTIELALSGATVYGYRNGVSLTSKNISGTGIVRGGAPGFGFIKAAGTQIADNWLGRGAIREWDTSSTGTDFWWRQVSGITDADGGVDFVLRVQTEFPAFRVTADEPVVITASASENP